MTTKGRFSKKQFVLFAILGIAIVLVSLWAWNQVAPRPLGDRLEYLGKEDYGSILGLDYSPYSVYFYGTDMEVEEVVAYFPKAELRYPIERKSGYIEIILGESTSEETATIYYYSTPDKAQMSFSTNTDKLHVIKTRDANYQLLKNSM